MWDRAPHAIILDDDEQIAALFGELIGSAGYRATVTTTADDFRAAIAGADAQLIVLDLQMPELDGIEALRLLAEHQCSAGVLLVTGMDQRTVSAAEEYGRSRSLDVLGSLRKPFSPPEFIEKLQTIRSAHRKLTVADIENAIEQAQLDVYYQPTIRRFADRSWDVSAVEALIRWNHPERGLLTPDAFLQLGEDGGLARPIADYVLQRGVEQLRAWQNQGHCFGLRVNIAAQLIGDLDFPDRLEVLLREHCIDPSLLTLEITETAMLEHEARTIDILTRLRVKEINLAIDDFGIGYSSLTQLFRMPFNEMKIDKSLVMNVPQSKEARIMVETLVGLAHKLGLRVCAEGIEAVDVLRFLDEIACDSVQGFLVSEPVPPGGIPEIVRRWPQTVSGSDAVRLAV